VAFGILNFLQVSIECVERGELLSLLRDKYSDLFNKVPQQIKGWDSFGGNRKYSLRKILFRLHEEVLAQRALDRRLTEELMRFKTTIRVLTRYRSQQHWETIMFGCFFVIVNSQKSKSMIRK
jgi:hypothetical protein